MTRPEVHTSLTLEGGVFKTHEVFADFTLETPTAPIPVRHLTRKDKVAESTLELAEVYVRLSEADLDAYDKGQSTNAIEKLDSVKERYDDEVVVVFIEYTETKPLDYVQIQTYVELQAEYSSIITFPCLPVLSDALSPHDEAPVEFTVYPEGNPFGAMIAMVEDFVTIVEDDQYDKSVMGVIPLASGDVRDKLFQRYVIDHGFRFVAMDFRGLKATKDAELELLEAFMKGAANKTRLEGTVLYALNFLPYYSYDRNLLPFEALTLVRLGFDIVGRNHVSRGVGGDSPTEDQKIVEPSTLGIRKVPIDSLSSKWPVGSTIPPERFEEVGDSKQGELRKLVNSEATVSVLQDLRDELESGNGREFITSRKGVTQDENDIAARFEEAYRNAVGPDLT